MKLEKYRDSELYEANNESNHHWKKFVREKVVEHYNNYKESKDMKEFVAFLTYCAMEQLSNVYDVNDLSILEQRKLREITENCLEQQKSDLSHGASPQWVFDAEKEALYQFLNIVYGVDLNQLRSQLEIINFSSKEKFIYEAGEMRQGMEKYQELKKSGQDISGDDLKIPDDIKKLIRRLRENSHAV